MQIPLPFSTICKLKTYYYCNIIGVVVVNTWVSIQFIVFITNGYNMNVFELYKLVHLMKRI